MEATVGQFGCAHVELIMPVIRTNADFCKGDCVSGSVDASLRHCCAAAAHINANLKISHRFHSVACRAASMLSLVNQSKTKPHLPLALPAPTR
jgi:hypothetical protein